MEGLLTFLLFGALFFVMMRFGCGAHVHGGHGGHGAQAGPQGHAGHDHAGGAVDAGSKDPVCGMDVSEGQGYTKMHEGRALRFCSRRCLDQFDSNPGQYLAPEGGRP